ncbi:MAG: hypothetical protein K2J93_05455 [Anaeroplasmataceae bacterium]|nr:hypothetical protein [Anaeroplasmataceae bacterium]
MYIRFLKYSIHSIVKKYGEQAFELNDQYLTIKLPYNSKVLSDNVHQSVAQNVVQKQDSIKQIRALIKSNNRITRKEMADVIGVSVKTIERIIRNNANIRYVGSSKLGHWEIDE